MSVLEEIKVPAAKTPSKKPLFWIPALILAGTGASLQSAARPGDARPRFLHLSDLDGDGRLDKLVWESGRLAVQLNRGGGSFEVAPNIECASPVGCLVGELDDDGEVDVLLMTEAGVLAFVGEGAGRLREATEDLGLANAAPCMGAERLDLDGAQPLELVLRSLTGDQLYWFDGGRFRRDEDSSSRGKADFGALANPGLGRHYGNDDPGGVGLRDILAPGTADSPRGALPHAMPPAPNGAPSRTAHDSNVSESPVTTAPIAVASTTCAQGLADQANPGSCIGASSVPELGKLLPLSQNLFVDPQGRVGVGTTNPAYPLDINGSMESSISTGHVRVNNYSASTVPSWEIKNASARNTWLCFAQVPSTSGGDGDLHIVSRASSTTGTGTVRIRGQSSDIVHLDVDGDISARVLTIRGADLAEGFDVAPSGRRPGTLLAVDPRGGQLLPSSSPYQREVIGAVSGAGGVRPGLRLAQEGIADGETQVAMVGQVYVWCTSENGQIVPGSLITTSSTPGHGMKATDSERSFGAVVGKALTGLEGSKGLVLVSINLQ